MSRVLLRAVHCRPVRTSRGCAELVPEVKLAKLPIEMREPLAAVPEGKKMRRATAVLMVGMLLLALAPGVALAAEVASSDGACTGTRNQDSITGTDTTDEILALGGKDFVDARGGADEVHGSEGGDRLFGDKNDRALDGNDEVYGGAIIVYLFGLGGSDLLDGGPDNDFIFAQEFNERAKGTTRSSPMTEPRTP